MKEKTLFGLLTLVSIGWLVFTIIEAGESIEADAPFRWIFPFLFTVFVFFIYLISKNEEIEKG